MSCIIDGRKIAQEFSSSIKSEVEGLKCKGIYPRIALINASSDSASEIYVSKKSQAANYAGIKSDIYKFDESVQEEDIAVLIQSLNADVNTHAILLQSPLSHGMDFRKLVDLIDYSKDVDGLTTTNQGRLFSGNPYIIPCTPLGVLHMLHTVHKNIAGMHAVILGRSAIVGRPMAALLLRENCTVTIVHSQSHDIPKICKSADILISAIGKPHFIKGDFVKKGAIVIDVGINRIIVNGKAKIVGDVAFDEVSGIASAISPVPNGVGPMTVACLMYNTLKLAKVTVG